MQLNPARGRKHRAAHVLADSFDSRVYAAQPREGTETSRGERQMYQAIDARFMQLNPARGRKLSDSVHVIRPEDIQVYAAQPREGTETFMNPPCLI